MFAYSKKAKIKQANSASLTKTTSDLYTPLYVP